MTNSKTHYTAKDASTFLREHYQNATITADALGAGEWSQAFSFSKDGRDLVVRLGQYGDLFKRDQMASKYASPDLPIPTVLEVGRNGSGYYAVSERVFGTMIDHLDNGGFRRVMSSLFETLDAIRRIDISETTGFGPLDEHGNGRYGSWSEYLMAVDREDQESRIVGWRKKLVESQGGEAAFNAAYNELVRIADELPNVRGMVHNDFLNRNVMVRDDRICGVFDWANALYGDFLYDLAQFTFWAPWYPAMAGIDWLAEAKHHFEQTDRLVPGLDLRLTACHIHMGLSAQSYFAMTGRDDLLARTARRTLEVAGLRNLD